MHRVFALAAVLFCCSFALAEEPEPEVVGSFKGKGTAQTAVFPVEDDWSVKWESRGRIMIISIFREGEKTSDYRIYNGGDPLPGQGKFDISNGGRYFVRVYGDATWKITILQHKGF